MLMWTRKTAQNMFFSVHAAHAVKFRGVGLQTGSVADALMECRRAVPLSLLQPRFFGHRNFENSVFDPSIQVTFGFEFRDNFTFLITVTLFTEINT